MIVHLLSKQRHHFVELSISPNLLYQMVFPPQRLKKIVEQIYLLLLLNM